MPAQQPLTVDATFYAQVKPIWNTWQKVDGEPKLESAKVIKITQSKPENPESGCVVVKLTVRLPASSFLPLKPEAIVVIEDPAVENAIQSILTGSLT